MAAASNNDPPPPNNRHLLDETSVVLITGAAGHLGSEVALALHRIYRPKQLILLDSLEKATDDLNTMEFQRQRIFRLLQEMDDDSTTAVSFYRVDVRPAVPEYYDSSEVPVLDHVLQLSNLHNHNPVVTHIFHAARGNSMGYHIIPRSKGLEKAGLMESLLEQVLAWNRTQNDLPSFVYVSDMDVLGRSSSSSSGMTTNGETENDADQHVLLPQTRKGAAAAIQELIAARYYERVPSTGLRFASLYGPWDRHSPVFGLVERHVNNNVANPEDPTHDATAAADDEEEATTTSSSSSYDLVYIDDAVDAVLTALQLPHAVGSIPITSGTSVTDDQLASFLAHSSGNNNKLSSPPPPLAQPAARAKDLLNWEPRVNIMDGLQYALEWQTDRAAPYTSRERRLNNNKDSCDTYDAECWNGTPIFPCAAECANEYHCKSTAWDDVLAYTQAIGTCPTILYTVHLDPRASTIPSAFVRVSTQSKAYLTTVDHDAAATSSGHNGASSSSSGHPPPQQQQQGQQPHCNIAFVAHTSPLFLNSNVHNNNNGQQHGFWTLVPVAATAETYETLSLLPRLSPGLFFGENVKTAIYVDPDILIDDIDALIETVSSSSDNSGTILLTGRHTLDPVQRQRPTPPTRHAKGTNTARERAYRMMQIAMLEHGIRLFPSALDTGVIVYGQLHDPNARLFRCDVLSELVQWNKTRRGDDAASLAFMLSLHDLWSRVVAERSGQPVEWTEAGEKRNAGGGGRRLEEVNDGEEDGEEKEKEVNNGEEDGKEKEEEEVNDEEEVVKDEHVAIKTAIKSREENKSGGGKATTSAEEATEEKKEEAEQQELLDITAVEAEAAAHIMEERPVSNDDDTVEGGTGAAGGGGPRADAISANGAEQHQHNGFGVVDAIEAVLGLKQQERTNENQEDDFVVDDDDRNAGAAPKFQPVKHDSDDDIVMGILSSPKQQYFARIATLESIGIYRVTEDLLMQQFNAAASGAASTAT